MNTTRIWTALLEVKGMPEGDHVEVEGAFVRGVVIAETLDEAIDWWRRGLDSMDFELLDVDEHESLDDSETANRGSVLQRLIVKARRTRLPEFGAFHQWLSEDEESEE